MRLNALPCASFIFAPCSRSMTCIETALIHYAIRSAERYVD